MDNKNQIEALNRIRGLITETLEVTHSEKVPDDDGETILYELLSSTDKAIRHFDESISGTNLWRYFLKHAKQEVENSAFWIAVSQMAVDCLFEIHAQTGHITVTADYTGVETPSLYSTEAKRLVAGLSEIVGIDLEPHVISAQTYTVKIDKAPRLVVFLPRRIAQEDRVE